MRLKTSAAEMLQRTTIRLPRKPLTNRLKRITYIFLLKPYTGLLDDIGSESGAPQLTQKEWFKKGIRSRRQPAKLNRRSDGIEEAHSYSSGSGSSSVRFPIFISSTWVLVSGSS